MSQSGSNSTFTTSSNITVPGVVGSIDVYIKVEGGHFTLCHDPEGKHAYGSQPEIPVEVGDYALYFRFTEGSDPASFEAQPFSWKNGHPECIYYELIKPDRTAFSIRDANLGPQAHSFEFDLGVITDGSQGRPRCRRVHEVDPTILNKGEGGF